MNPEQSLVCFKHCSKLVFCKSVPDICPVCDSVTFNCSIPPFQIPCPFTNAVQNPVSIVIKPSRGNFMNDYDINNDLHIGVVNSASYIYEFDKCGLVKNDFTAWKCCIAINLVPKAWYEHWDEILDAVCSKWSSHNYNDSTLNCFSFVIDFVNNLKYKEIKFLNKEQMCCDFILPKIQEAIRFALIFRKLKDSDHFIQE